MSTTTGVGSRMMRPARPGLSRRPSVQLVLWLFASLCLSVAVPVMPLPTAGARPMAPTGTQQAPMEEDHHSSTSTVVLHAVKGERRAPGIRRGSHLLPAATIDALGDVSRQLQNLDAEAREFALKLHRARLPWRTSPSDGGPHLS